VCGMVCLDFFTVRWTTASNHAAHRIAQQCELNFKI